MSSFFCVATLLFLALICKVHGQKEADIRGYYTNRKKSHCDRAIYATSGDIVPKIELYDSIRAVDIESIGISDHDMIYQVNTVDDGGRITRSLLISWNINEKGPKVITDAFVSEVMELIKDKWIEYKTSEYKASKKVLGKNSVVFKPEVIFFSFQEYGAKTISKDTFNNAFKWILKNHHYIPSNPRFKGIGTLSSREVIGILFLSSRDMPSREIEFEQYCYPIRPDPQVPNHNGIALASQKLDSGNTGSAVVVTKGFVYTKTAVKCYSPLFGGIALKYVAAHFPFAGKKKKSTKLYDEAYRLRVKALDQVLKKVDNDKGITFLVGDLNFRIRDEDDKDELTELMAEEECKWKEGQPPEFDETCKRIKMKNGKAKEGDEQDEEEEKEDEDYDSDDLVEESNVDESANKQDKHKKGKEKSAHQFEMNILKRQEEKVEEEQRRVNYLKLEAMEAKMKLIMAKRQHRRRSHN